MTTPALPSSSHLVGDMTHVGDHNMLALAAAAATYAANNLSDVASAATALANIGGVAATSIVTVATATGNDGTQLRAAITGTGDVYLHPGATYTISDTTIWPAFSGHVHGQGATLNFTGQPSYTGSVAPIGAPGNGAWSNVVVENVTFTTSAGCTWSAIFGSACGRLVFVDCTTVDMVTRMTNPTAGDLEVIRHQFLQSAAPSGINQAFSVPGAVQTSLASSVTTSTATTFTTTAAAAAGIVGGNVQGVYGPGIPAGTTITSVSLTSGTYTVTMSNAATASATVTLYFWTILPGYHCVLEDAKVEFQQTASTGSILSAVATAPGVGSSVEVRGGSAFASGLYYMDGVIDIEPVGWQPFGKVSIHDFDVTNASLYLTGADYIDAGKGCKFRYNSVNANHKCLPFNGYNNNYTANGNGPSTAIVDLHDFQVFEDAVVSTGTPFIVDYEVPITSLRVHDWDVTLNPETAFASLGSKAIFYTASSVTRFVLESGRISGGISASKSSCTTTNTSNQVTFASPLPTPTTGVNLPANVSVGWTVTGTGIPASTTITAISLSGSTYTLTLSANATASGTVTLSFLSPYSASGLVGCGTNPAGVEIHGVEMGTTVVHVLGLTAGSGTVTLVDVSGNDLTQAGSRSIFFSGVTITDLRWKNNAGSNPVGSSVPGSAFSLAGSGSAWTNATGVDGTLYCTAAGTVTAVSVGGVTVSGTMAIGDTYRVPAGGTFTVTYSGAPTLVFVGE